MKKLWILVAVFSITSVLTAQVTLPHYPDSLFSTYYFQRYTLFQELPPTDGDIVFLGNSITDGCEWSELFNDLHLKNRGISGDISAGIVNRIDEVARRKPAAIFLMIGVNDLARGYQPDTVFSNIMKTAAYIRQETARTRFYVQSILPVNDIYGKFSGHTARAAEIKKLNALLKSGSAKGSYTYIDLFDSFCDDKGKLKPGLSNDGLHLNGTGYIIWKHLVYPYVYNLQDKPSLIPLPVELQWKPGYFPAYACKTLVITDSVLNREGKWLKDELIRRGIDVSIRNSPVKGSPCIKISLGKVESPSNSAEAYHLTVNSESIDLASGSSLGIFNGMQTLLQLLRDGVFADACEITDWPAFPWRGYMVDVGRNYMSPDLLKQQIDIMAKYKLNVFHFHATEDIAWRFEIRKYPQLTAPENMLRNKGMYYSVAEIKELIAYCRDRHIEFVPEIDMPGHSAAFKRAMKTDMQSDSGLVYVKEILKEICETYDLMYIHIGADEVKISRQDFIPAVTDLLEGFGKKVIGWEPGGNFSSGTIRQLWRDDGSKLSGNVSDISIDSRHLYLNHMDPLESVVTIFNRKLGERIAGTDKTLGGTICLWNDRAVAREEDLLKMNAVYPSMLAFSERSWRGGGQEGWVANISDGDEGSFVQFENRLIDHHKLWFSELPFPYQKQSDLRWRLLGPFKNEGELTRRFDPELPGKSTGTSVFYKEVTGGTIILRHWWAPLVRGAIDNPEQNTTWYASGKIWSDEDQVKEFWIGFNNLSRSYASDSPPSGAWDYKGSKVWVNGKEIPAPQWKRPGQKGNPEIPLTDQGYEYRPPVKIPLVRGWNSVLVKCPVGSFRGPDFQNPVKWMFTFVPVNN